MPEPDDAPVSPERSRIMAAIRGKDTKPEMLVRRHLHRLGLRYSLHDRNLPGRPDVTLRRHRATVLVHGCFWHGHACRQGRLPMTRRAFWEGKIATNQARDARNEALLREAGWRVFVVWECELGLPGRLDALASGIRDGTHPPSG